MKFKNLFTRKTTIEKEEKKKKSFSQNSNLPRIKVDNNKYLLLSEIDTLSTFSYVIMEGVLNNEDLTLLKNKLKAGLSSFAANAVLKEIDMGNSTLDANCIHIDFKEMFNFCINLTNVTLPDASLYNIDTNFQATFRGCSKLKTIHNFNTYKHISNLNSTFCFCNLLSEIEITSNPFPKGNADTFQKTNRDFKIKIPQGVKIPSTWIQINTENVIVSEK